MTDGSLELGSILGERYVVKKRLDEGGMQVVYVAQDETFDRLVAVKVPKSASAEKRFQRSAVLSARVNHPNVAKTLDFLPGPPVDVLVEEFIDGMNLRKFADMYHRMDPYLVGHLVHHLAKGVAVSHRAGVVHRDLKPSNIMVTGGHWPCEIKITDFGIARMAQEELEEALESGVAKSITTSATLVGALPYMSPEFVSDSKTADKPADVWSIGAIAYELLSGKPPFGAGLPAVANILGTKAPKKPQVFGSKNQFGPFVDALWEIIKRCLNRDVGSRISADELIEACEGLCYSAAERRTGIVRNFGEGVGSFGFIEVEDGPDVFFHEDSFYGTDPSPGTPVSFSAFKSGARPRAHPVVPLNG